ncbi:hypothetical protein LJC29_00960 [Bacteroides sp. OttesenSCG-928-N06]|nr:hypothetical protein [Bacteroides sp. OttesenSCG-928-N06]
MKSPLCAILVALMLAPAIALHAQDEPQVQRERQFAGTALYGFMNGGADLYFEYGVQQLISRDILYGSQEFTLDIYQMPTPADAYGIYSMHVFRCQRADTLGTINCLSAYQYQMAVGSRYISIVFPSGSSLARQLAPSLAAHFLPSAAQDPPIAFPAPLPVEAPYSGRVKFVRGPLSALGASVGLYTLLKDIAFASAWFVGEKTADDFRALVFLPDAAEGDKLKARLAPNDVLDEGNGWLLVRGVEVDEEKGDGGFGF